MKAAELVVRCLENEGVRYIFGLPGEENLDLMDALSRSERIQFVTTRHEQGAAFMADVYGRVSTYPGVCLATLGPGATNLITGVADAYLDRAPLVALTGQAALGRHFKESHQYVDVVRMLAPVTRWNTSVDVPASIPEVVRKAFRLARIEKPSATHIDLPEDVARAEVEGAPLPVRRTTYPVATEASVEAAAELLAAASQPVILAGNGVVRRQAAGYGAVDALRTFARRLSLPVATTFMGKGVMPFDDPLTEPAAGLRSPLPEDAALHDADLVLAVGYDLVEWAPSLWNARASKTVVHVDSVPAEVDACYNPAVEVVGEIGSSLDRLAAACATAERAPARRAAHAAEALRGELGDTRFPLHPRTVVAQLRDALAPEDTVICDVGAHKLWMSTLFPVSVPNTLIVANGLASMGIAVPGAVAAKLWDPARRVVAVTGDGGFLMNAQELETAKRAGAAFVAVVWRDDTYGVIGLNQERQFGRRFAVDFGNPDLVAFAGSFGLPGFRVERAEDLGPTLRRALDEPLPSVVEVPVDRAAHAELGQS